MAEAIRDLQEDISQLKGTWEVTIKVANSVPIKWDVEEVRPPRHSRSS